MNIKGKIFFSMLVIVFLFSVIYFFYNFLNKNNPQNVSLNSAPPAEKKNKISPQSIKTSLFQSQNNNQEILAQSRQLPTEIEIANRFALPNPSETDFGAYIAQLLLERENDKTGTSDLKIAKVLEFCENVPRDERDLIERKKIFEKYAADNGQDNGQVQHGVSGLEDEYKMCAEVKHKVMGETAYNFYKKSADAGLALAEVELATNVLPSNYASYSKEEKITYQEKMGQLLSDARSKCEPTAFLAFAYRSDAKNKMWSLAEEGSSDLNRYANMFAHSIYYVKKVAGGMDKVGSYDAELKAMFPRFSDADIKDARDFGASMYKQYCENN